MLPLKARVRNGRLVVDAPTTLPEGTELDLVAVGEDDLDASGRAALHGALLEGEADADAGNTVSAEDVLARLRSRRAS